MKQHHTPVPWDKHAVLDAARRIAPIGAPAEEVAVNVELIFALPELLEVVRRMVFAVTVEDHGSATRVGAALLSRLPSAL